MNHVNIRNGVLTTSLIALIGLLSGSAHAAPAADTSWVLTQISDKQGAIVIYIHNDQVKVDKMGSYSVICKGPSWNVILYNAKRRIISQRTFNNWLVHGVYSGLEFLHPPNKFDAVHAIDTSRKFSMFGVEVCRGAVLKNKNDRKPPFKARTIVAPSITADQHVFNFLRTFLDCDICLDFATLSFERNDTGGQQFMRSDAGVVARGLVRDISTTNVKKIPYSAKDYVAPVGFKNVPDAEVVMGPKSDLIDSFLEPGS